MLMRKPPHVTVPDMTGKVVLITGANTGIGKETARALAKAGAHVFLAGRSPERTEPVVAELRQEAGHDKVEFLPLDLSAFDSVRSGAKAFLARGLPLHLLINNAGVAGQMGLGGEGFEASFGVNHLGHFLLTLLLVDRLKESAPARIVTVASDAHYRAPGLDLERVKATPRTPMAFPEYCDSKLANVLFTRELGRRLEGSGVTAYSLHPGVVASDLWREVPRPVRWVIKQFMINNEEGARTTLHCATSPALASESGKYYDACKPKTPSKRARDDAKARALWEQSVAWTQAPDLAAPEADA